MRAVRTGLVIGLIAQLAALTALAGTTGLTGGGWVVGVTCGAITNVALARGLARSGGGAMGPADRVTLLRATLVGAVAALTADSFGRPGPVTTLVVVASVALVLDAVDGWVARRTGTVSVLGARFDMEVDAFLILVLSVYVVTGTMMCSHMTTTRPSHDGVHPGEGPWPTTRRRGTVDFRTLLRLRSPS